MIVTEEAGLEALGAVGGAPAGSAQDDLMDLVFPAPATDSTKAGREDGADTPKRPTQALHAHSTPTHSGSQSLHPPQFHRPVSHGGRPSDPHHVVRKTWKERHSDLVSGDKSSSHHSHHHPHPHHPHHHHHTPSPQRPMNPGINVWVSTNGQLSGNSSGSQGGSLSSASSASPPTNSAPAGLGDSPPFMPPRQMDKKETSTNRQASGEGTSNRVSQDSGNPLIEITDAMKTSGTPLIDLEQAEPLNPSEQQNSRIDENRLSMALSMFDPFAGEGEGDAAMGTNANNNHSGSGVGAVKDSFVLSSGAGDNLANVSSRSVDSAIELLCEDDSVFKEARANGGAAVSAGMAAEERDRGSQHQQRKSGTPPAAGGAPGSLQRDAPDNISIRSDEKVCIFQIITLSFFSLCYCRVFGCSFHCLLNRWKMVVRCL